MPASTAAGSDGGQPALSGHTRVNTQALTSVAKAAASEALQVPAEHVKADWNDDGGLLALSLVLPLGIPSLNRIVRDPSLMTRTGGPIWDRALLARDLILDRVESLTGSQLSRVDIRITGIRIQEGGRVR
ncbi:hypothetical protein [Arthrobacter castelli]|uniref:hypothetical protein n=1 Tax=Arthrobacter castelli TaxID=271431 RepID=UPI00055FABAE|nr:hypothetical protein [Arthrobacter castelli]